MADGNFVPKTGIYFWNHPVEQNSFENVRHYQHGNKLAVHKLGGNSSSRFIIERNLIPNAIHVFSGFLDSMEATSSTSDVGWKRKQYGNPQNRK
jgi:hypothetical protein